MEGTTSSAPYTPAPLLLSNSIFSSDELIAHFEDFRSTLRYANVAPDLVFERLVGNLNKAFLEALITYQRQFTSNHHTPECCAHRLCKKVEDLERTNQAIFESLKRCSSSYDHVEDREASGPLTSLDTSISLRTKSNPRIGGRISHHRGPKSEFTFSHSYIVPSVGPYRERPSVPIGITTLEIQHSKHLEFCCDLSGSGKDYFVIRIDALENILSNVREAGLGSVGLSWLEIEDDDPDFQLGSYCTARDNPTSGQITHIIKEITFDRVYNASPVVLVWLTGLSIRKEGAFRVRTYADDVTATSFKIHIVSWGGSLLHMSFVGWIAYTADIPRVCHGYLSTLDSSVPGSPQPNNTGFEEFKKDVFDTPPRVMLAIDSISADHEWSSTGLTANATVSSVSTTRMDWSLDAWTGTRLCGMSASYIAMA